MVCVMDNVNLKADYEKEILMVVYVYWQGEERLE
jgi:hypothetical protein